ncbi:MAG: hypothetical protein M1828_006959 [Chrysothrix sp. TS-e1954]|nr:MAG: hypothetical protein M1828_006959 [Chrysothrix sp. TS-e1954]
MVEYIKNIAILGATGNFGTHVTAALLKSERKQHITALSRPDSKASFPAGVTVKKVDYGDVDAIAQVLQGQDAVIIIVPFTASDDVQMNVIEAAAKANVPWVLPNEYGSDTGHKELVKAVPTMDQKTQFRERVEELGRSSWIGMITNPWFDMSFAMGFYGINVKDRTASFFGDGGVRINTTVLSTAGRSVAALLSLPVSTTDGKPSLSDYKNKNVYVSSFNMTQRELLEEVQTATQTTDSDWKVSSRPVDEVIVDGHARLKQGDFMGMINVLLGNTFKAGMGGEYESTKGLDNQKLGLPKDDFRAEVGKAVKTASAQ